MQSNILYTVFDLITTHNPISAVKQFHSLQNTARVLFIYLFIKAYVVGTHYRLVDAIQMSTHNMKLCFNTENQGKKKNHIKIIK